MDNCWHIIAINISNGENRSIGIIDISPDPECLPLPPEKWLHEKSLIKVFPDTGWGEMRMLWVPEKNAWLKI